MIALRDTLEAQQVKIYFGTITAAVLLSLVVPATTKLEAAINPALALMLFVTFLQVPLADLGRAFLRIRFLAALLIANFVAAPLLVLALIQFLPADPMVRLGVLFVLLTPCIDYVVTFSHIGRADAKLLLASTPALLVLQMLLLPIYLGLFLGEDAAGLVQMGPFLHAFVWLIAFPLALAAFVQLGAARNSKGGAHRRRPRPSARACNRARPVHGVRVGGRRSLALRSIVRCGRCRSISPMLSPPR